MEPIHIFEKGEWLEVEIVDIQRIEKTQFSDKPQYVFNLLTKQGTNSFWTKEYTSPRSKKFTLLTAALGNFFLKGNDSIDPRTMIGKKVLGLWGEEKNPKGEIKKAFLRFLPPPD